MTKHWTVRVTASLATLFALFAPAPVARADIFQWELVLYSGRQPSTMLCPDGAGVNAVPGAILSSRNLTMAYLIDTDLSGANASLTNLTNAELSDANLTNAHLIGADLSWATAIAATLTNAELRQANLRYANFSGYYDENYGYIYTDLTGANLSQANLTNAYFALATLTNANLSQANLTNAYFGDAVFTGANLTGAEVRSANFTKYNSDFGITAPQLYSTASYQAHDLTEIVLAGNNLAGVNLAGQNLTNAKFHTYDPGFTHTNLTGANLSQANLTNADLYLVTLTGANLTGAEVRGASFSHDTNSGDGSGVTPAQLYSTASYQAHDLSGLKLSGNYAGLNLAGQNLTNADFHRASLANANLSQANLAGADFSSYYDPYYDPYSTGSGGDLTGANLSGANLTNANFSGWTYSFYAEEGEIVVVITGADLTDANLSGADERGANFYLAGPGSVNTSNLIQSNGHIAGLDLPAGASLVVRDYDGNAAVAPIVVDQHLAMSATGTLRLVFDADPWDSTISFAPGIPVARGGTLELTFAPDVSLAGQVGRTIDLFDWTGVTPTGAFTVSSPYTWNLSKLYTTGEVTLTALSALAGDYSGNGTVGPEDYDVWRTSFGSTTLLAADGNHNGIVDAGDYSVWRDHLGATLGSGSGSALPSAGPLAASVPEPSSLALSTAGLLGIVFWANRRRGMTPRLLAGVAIH